MTLRQHLEQLQSSDEYPFHMPGHKRMPGEGRLSGAVSIDITEIIGYDNLHDPKGIIADAQQYASELYGAETYYLVNGSTVGILSAIMSVKDRGKVLIATPNRHRSVDAGAELAGLELLMTPVESVYRSNGETALIPGPVDTEALKRTIEDCESPAGVLITSPTYEGVMSDIASVADICHKKNCILIVDEAHGAHLTSHNNLPKGALTFGADIVIHSTHKMLSALTQTALLHIQGELADKELVRKYLRTLQSSSPSYVLMASIDDSLHELSEQGDMLWGEFFNSLMFAKEDLERLKRLKIIGADMSGWEMDPCKLVISTENCGITGYELQSILLDNYHLQIEMALEKYAVLLLTYKDSRQGLERLTEALLDIDSKIIEGTLKVNDNIHEDNKESLMYAPCSPGRM